MSEISNISTELIRTYGFKQSGDKLITGKCPSCGKRELWASASKPFIVHCNRLNNCNYTAKTRDLLPHLFQDFSKKHQPTQTNPNATADAYLELIRGININLCQCAYTQGNFWHPKADKGTATVRWNIPATEGKVYMERFVDAVTIKDDDETTVRKANFVGKYKGLWWQMPNFTPNPNEPIYIVEGIIDAMSLIQAGLQAVATLSCINYPDIALSKLLDDGKKYKFTWALDNDNAGKKYSKIYRDKMHEAGFDDVNIIFPPRPAHIKNDSKNKTDWNDLLLFGELDTHKIKDTLHQAKYLGKLFLASNADEKGALIYIHTKRNSFWFEWSNRIYWFEYPSKAIEEMLKDNKSSTEDDLLAKITSAGASKRIANCHPKCLYHEVSAINDEFNRYYFNITTEHGKTINAGFSGGQLSAPAEFKKRLLNVSAGSMWLGNAHQLDSYMLGTLGNLASVEVFDAVGYSTKHDAYIYPKLGIKDGQVVHANDEDFIEFGKTAVKTGAQTNMELAEYIGEDNWLNWIIEAYGAKGIVVLAYWLGTLFAEQIRDLHKSYPFLEIIGEPGSGKSTILEFLWKLFGREDYEGFDPSKSSLAARTRTFAQASNLPIVLIESDREEDQKKFQWDELKTAYNGRAIRSRGVKTGGNEVYEPPFRGALVISQNARVDASEAVMQRIVGVEFTKQNHNKETTAIAQKLESVPVEKVSGVLVHTLKNASAILKMFPTSFAIHKTKLLDNGIKIDRIAKNHAQVAAFIDVLRTFHKLPDAWHSQALDYLQLIAIERQQLVGDDSPVLIEFWEAFDYLNRSNRLNHSDDNNDAEIAINLNQIYDYARENGQTLPAIRELKRALRGSRRHRYLRQDVLWTHKLSQDYNDRRQIRCWIFKK